MDLSTLTSHISVRALRNALGGVALIYVLLGLYTAFNAGHLRTAMEDNLASYSVALLTSGDTAPISMHVSIPPRQEKEGETQHDAAAIAPPALVGKSLTAAPIEGFYKDVQGHKLPVRAPDNASPFDVYKRPFTREDDRPVIALALNGYGFSAKTSEEALEQLPADVSFILSPYMNNLNDWQAKARADGHEVWLNLPIESKQYPQKDLGPQLLLQRSSLQYNRDRLEWALGRFVGYAGVASHTDDLFAAVGPMTQGVFRNIFKMRGLGFFELNPDAPGLIEGLSASYGGAYIKTKIVLDQDITLLKEAFAALEKEAYARGVAVGVLSANPTTIAEMARWIAALEHKGFVVAPISAAADIIAHE